MLLSEVEGAAAAAAAAPRNEPPARDGTQDDAPASAAGGPSSSLKDRFRALLLAESRKQWDRELSELGDGCVAPFRATPRRTIDAVLRHLALGADDVLYDLGCGEGHWCVAATRASGCRSVGIELSPEIAERARQRVASELGESTDGDGGGGGGGGSRVRIEVRDMMAAGGLGAIEEATVVIVYAGRDATKKLAPELRRRLRPGTRVVSVHFAVPGWPTELVETGGAARVYYYVL
jgi:SAM-dependent methyltransferase